MPLYRRIISGRFTNVGPCSIHVEPWAMSLAFLLLSAVFFQNVGPVRLQSLNTPTSDPAYSSRQIQNLWKRDAVW